MSLSAQTIKQVEAELAEITTEDYVGAMWQVLQRHGITWREWEVAGHAWMDRPHTVRYAKGDSALCRCGRYASDSRGGIHLAAALPVAS